MKPFTHISKQWLVIDRLVKNWRCFVLAQKLIATVLLLSINQPLLAKPLDGFCLSRTDPSQIDPEKKHYSANDSHKSLSFTANGKNYFLQNGGSGVSLYQVNNGKNVHLQTVKAWQSGITFFDLDPPSIRKVRLADNGLVLIDGPYIDYVAWIDFNEPLFKINTDGWGWIGEVINPIVTFFDKPPSISTPVRLAELSSIECRIPVINWFIDYCDRTKLKYYNSNSNRVFFSAPHFFGLISPTDFEIVDDVVRAVPNDIAEKIDFKFGYYDVPVPNSVLVKGTQNEMLLYDGKQLIPVPFDRSLYGDKFSWKILLNQEQDNSLWLTPNSNSYMGSYWNIKSHDGKQTFLEIINHTKQKKFLVKLKADGSLVPILAGSFSDPTNNCFKTSKCRTSVLVSSLPNPIDNDYFHVMNDISFYDGIQFTPLLENITDENEFFWKVLKSPISNRFFLLVKAGEKQKMFFMELENDGSFKKPILTRNLYHIFIDASILEMPQPLTLFLLTESDLSIEINDVFRSVISVKQPNILRPDGLAYIGKPPYDALSFKLEIYSTGKNRNYFIVRTSPQANCIAELDPDKPIVLNADD